MPLSRYIGMFTPGDLDMMRRVFDVVSKERGAAEDLEQREALAAQIVSLFGRGMTNEADLLHAISKRRNG
jgi:hypothetical protein